MRHCSHWGCRKESDTGLLLRDTEAKPYKGFGVEENSVSRLSMWEGHSGRRSSQNQGSGS